MEVFGGTTVLAINADFFTLQVTLNRLDGSLEPELWFESADCSGHPRMFRFAFEEPLVLPAALRGTELWAPQRPVVATTGLISSVLNVTGACQSFPAFEIEHIPVVKVTDLNFTAPFQVQ
jgi:hypothetical protein